MMNKHKINRRENICKLKSYLNNLIKNNKKETISEMVEGLNCSEPTIRKYIRIDDELKDLYAQCIRRKARKTTNKKTIEKKENKQAISRRENICKLKLYLNNLIKNNKKETISEIVEGLNCSKPTIRKYIRMDNELKELSLKCLEKKKRKKADKESKKESLIKKWERGEFERIFLNDIDRTQEDNLKEMIIKYVEDNSLITVWDVRKKFRLSKTKLSLMKKNDVSFRKELNAKLINLTQKREIILKKNLDNSTEKKTIKELSSVINQERPEAVYRFLSANPQYNKKVNRKNNLAK